MLIVIISIISFFWSIDGLQPFTPLAFPLASFPRRRFTHAEAVVATSKEDSACNKMLSEDKKGWFLEISDSILRLPLILDKESTSRGIKRAKSFDLISGTNRVDGRKKWSREVANYDRNTNTSMQTLPLMCELAKELLYSGIPEQTIELYCSFRCHQDALSSYEYFRLSVITTRALLRMGELDAAKTLLKRSYSRYRPFERVTPDEQQSVPSPRKKRSAEETAVVRDLSEAVAEMAQHSKEGLQEALSIRQAMLARGHSPLLAIGSAGLLKGLYLHLLSGDEASLTPSPSPSPSPLMKSLTQEISSRRDSDGINATDYSIGCVETLLPSEIEALAHDLASPHLVLFEQNTSSLSSSSPSPPSTSGGSRRAQRVIAELVRVLFRSAAAQQGALLRARHDMNFQPDSTQSGQQRTVLGLSSVLTAMSTYQLQWDADLAEVLLDECLRQGGGDTAGIEVVIRCMWEQQLHARTGTFNALLRRYAESGDAESAFNMATGVMRESTHTRPNAESWALVLAACLKSRKGLVYAEMVHDLFFHSDSDRAGGGGGGGGTERAQGEVSKEMWDLFLQWKILSCQSPIPLLAKMVQSPHQPDSKTLLRMYQSYHAVGEAEAALALYSMQRGGVAEHQVFAREGRAKSLIWSSSPTISFASLVDGLDRVEESSLPPGTTRESVLRKVLEPALPPPCTESCRLLLELLRNSRAVAKAVDLLDELLLAATQAPATPSDGTVAAYPTALSTGDCLFSQAMRSRRCVGSSRGAA